MNIKELGQRVSKDVYAAAVKHYEEAERAGLIVVGNGHHMAQSIARVAEELLLLRHEKTKVPAPVETP